MCSRAEYRNPPEPHRVSIVQLFPSESRDPSPSKLTRWWNDEGGLEPAEWAIVLGAAIVPIAYFILQITLYLTRFYQITSWITTLPFP